MFIAFILSMLNPEPLPLALSVGIMIAHSVCIAVGKPYVIKHENIRALILQIIGVLNLSIYLMLSITGPSYSILKGFSLYSPYVVLSLGGIACLVSVYFVFEQIRRYLSIQLNSLVIPEVENKLSVM